MTARLGFLIASLLPLWSVLITAATPLTACCPAGPQGKPVINADQTVIMIWDAERKMQHFIRQASFKSEAEDFGFLVPTPSQPELEESGNEAFPLLAKITAPEIKRVARSREGAGCACSSGEHARPNAAAEDAAVTVLAEKRVAGFDAKVLEATSAEALVTWLNEHGYAFSPEVEAWAQPYIEQGWKITALKVAKEEGEKQEKQVGAAALRLSFQTDRPLFPYREPDPARPAEALNATQRLLRIFFVADARYQGELTKDNPWTGTVAWSGKMNADSRKQLLDVLKLPEETGPAEYWLTEFEDNWPYKAAPADLYFAKDASQETVKRPPQIQYVEARPAGDVTLLAFVALALSPLAWRRWRGRR